MEFIKSNWPLLLIALYFIYRQVGTYKIKKMLPALKAQGALLIDVRSEGEFAGGHAPGTINIPLNTLAEESKKLPKYKSIVVCCANGTRSAFAKKILQRNGFRKTFNAGSWRALMQ